MGTEPCVDPGFVWDECVFDPVESSGVIFELDDHLVGVACGEHPLGLAFVEQLAFIHDASPLGDLLYRGGFVSWASRPCAVE